MRTIIAVEELDALPDYSPVRIRIVGTAQWLEGYGYATRSPNGFWWLTGQGNAMTSEQLFSLANGGIETIIPESPEGAVTMNILGHWVSVCSPCKWWCSYDRGSDKSRADEDTALHNADMHDPVKLACPHKNVTEAVTVNLGFGVADSETCLDCGKEWLG